MIAGENKVLIHDETVRRFIKEGFLGRNRAAKIVDEIADDAEMRRSASILQTEAEEQQKRGNGAVVVERGIGGNREAARFELVENR